MKRFPVPLCFASWPTSPKEVVGSAQPLAGARLLGLLGKHRDLEELEVLCRARYIRRISKGYNMTLWFWSGFVHCVNRSFLKFHWFLEGWLGGFQVLFKQIWPCNKTPSPNTRWPNTLKWLENRSAEPKSSPAKLEEKQRRDLPKKTNQVTKTKPTSKPTHPKITPKPPHIPPPNTLSLCPPTELRWPFCFATWPWRSWKQMRPSRFASQVLPADGLGGTTGACEKKTTGATKHKRNSSITQRAENRKNNTTATNGTSPRSFQYFFCFSPNFKPNQPPNQNQTKPTDPNQPTDLTKPSDLQVSLLSASEPLWAALCASVLLHESLAPTELMGGSVERGAWGGGEGGMVVGGWGGVGWVWFGVWLLLMG